MKGAGAAWRRLVILTRHDLSVLVRQRALAGLVLLCLPILGAGWMLRDLRLGDAPADFMVQLAESLAAFMGAGIAVVTTTQLFFGELDSGATATVLAQGTRRAERLIAHWLAVVAVGGLFCGVTLAAATALPAEHAIAHGLGPGIEIFLRQWTSFALVVALTLGVASYARRPGFALMMSGWLVFLAYARPWADDLVSFTRVVPLLLGILPDLSRFQARGAFDAEALFAVCSYGGCYLAGWLGAAVIGFGRRDL